MTMYFMTMNISHTIRVLLCSSLMHSIYQAMAGLTLTLQVSQLTSGGHKEMSSILADYSTLVYEPKCAGFGGGWVLAN
jgi:hypothetical protein